ncbi:phage minor capsid protein [Humibacter sp.]|uniref:phage minor capsid protein n=1 Tax=Humibacter sp. TaxID=1940291 RepID=UPI003F7EF804
MVSPQQPPSDDLAAQVTAAYILAEQQLLGGATSILRRTTATPAGQLQALALLKRLVARILPHLAAFDRVAQLMVATSAAEGGRRAQSEVSKALATVHAAGSGGGIRPPFSTALAREPEPFDLSMPHGERAAQAIRDDLVSALQDVRFRLTRLPDDVYKAIAPHGGIRQVLDNNWTPAQAQAAAWRVFTMNGITGFTDRAGRNWSMSAYTEMAVRTSSARAFNDSHMQVMRAVGIKYFTVPADGHPCPLCFPWQHTILTDGLNPDPDVHADGTIAEATAAGLWHPNCRHTLAPYFPGVTKLPARQPWTDELAENYKNTQRQRALEREIRKAKAQLEYATDAQSKQIAMQDIRSAQRRLRDFLAQTGLARQTRREQLNLANDHIKMPPRI